jgi:3-hydroxyisobutyrate dehydrogenase
MSAEKDVRVGWIGTGVMGSSMCGHVLDAGYSVTAYTRTKARAQPLLDKGASWADNPAAVARAADVIFTIVGFPEDVRAVLLGPDGVIENASPGATVVDMTTTEPSLAVELYDAARANSIQAIDAPVSGGDIGARNAALSIMVGGDDDAIFRVMPLLECMGKMIVRQGGAGAGQHTKMVNQILIASGMIGVCEALLYGYRAGLDLDTVLESVGGGAAGSWSLANYGPRMLAGDYEPGFFVEHFIKDMGIALSEARRMRLALPGLALAHQLYVALESQGGGRRGIQALLLALASISAVDWPKPEPAS